jgi:predicted transcriptional regulator
MFKYVIIGYNINKEGKMKMQTSVTIDSLIKKRVKELAEKKMRSFSFITNEALKLYLESQNGN